MNSPTGKGVVTAIFETNSTDDFTFLDGMIGIDQADVDAVGNREKSLYGNLKPAYHMKRIGRRF